MPRKKKEETTASSKPVRKPKSPAKVPVVKKASKTSSTAKKTAVKKAAVKSPVKKEKAPVTLKKQPSVSQTDKKKQSLLDSSDPVITTSFKSLVRKGETQLVAFVRDPQCVFTYWEVTPEKLEEVKKELREEFKDSYMVLRLYHVQPNGEQILFDEIRLEPAQINRYVELKETGKSYVLEIGQKTPTGRYISYAKSSQVSTGPQIYTGSHGKNETQVFLEEGMSQDLLSYYKEQGYDPEGLAPTEKISSAENLKRLRGINRSSSF